MITIAGRLMVLLRRTAEELKEVDDYTVLYIPYPGIDPKEVFENVSGILRIPLSMTTEGEGFTIRAISNVVTFRNTTITTPVELKVNVGLERKMERKPGQRTRWESRNLIGVTFSGDWKDPEAHRAFRARITEENPGWRVAGYAVVS